MYGFSSTKYTAFLADSGLRTILQVLLAVGFVLTLTNQARVRVLSSKPSAAPANHQIFLIIRKYFTSAREKLTEL